jgi:glycosyltransferase involved in cell wall biosynthesis
MKLLFVHENFGEFGGAEVNVRIAASELGARGYTVGLLYCRATGRNEARWHETFSRCFCLPNQANIEMVEAVLEQFEPDVIYLHNMPDLEVVQALVESRIPVVRMVHDHSMYCMRTYKYNYFSRRICTRPFSPYCLFPCLASLGRGTPGGQALKWVSYRRKQREIALNQRCAAFVVYSNYLKDELLRNGFEAAKIEICVPLRTQCEGGQTTSLSAENLVLFVGQIIRGKGVDVLLKSLALVKTDFHCLILGDGNHRSYCEQLSSQLNLSNRVQFRGYVPPTELKNYYLRASVFAMSSLWPEPFGMAGPEAMRYGVPVVAFDAGGISEWLRDGDNGYLVHWKDTERFAARIEELLRNKDLARLMGRRALESIQQYDAARQINILEQLFQRVVQYAHASGSAGVAPACSEPGLARRQEASAPRARPNPARISTVDKILAAYD